MQIEIIREKKEKERQANVKYIVSQWWEAIAGCSKI